MTRGTDKLARSIKKFVDLNYKLFTRRYGQQLMDILEFPVKVVLSPFTLPFDIAGSAPRGFGVPEFISKLSYSAVFGVMKCPECNGKFPLRISADDIMEPPWKACDILRKMDYPYEDLDLPLNASSWSEEDLKDPKKQYEMTILLNAQREIADKILDTQWETKWRAEKLNEMLREKVEPYLQNIDNGVLPQPIVLQSQNHAQKLPILPFCPTETFLGTLISIAKSILVSSVEQIYHVCCREIRAGDDGGCFNGLGLQVEVSIHEAHIDFEMPWPLPG
ncbi:UNVERIFIED_CONTAM: hypothetical protein Sangu_2485000 [Sesamum angustifolium]|uniref:AtTam37 zinc finger domain-containing protein n=1 Tax=Sesamum angustifolium TaxID=2727405 RepID=A0AAW2IKH4_9LAMI